MLSPRQTFLCCIIAPVNSIVMKDQWIQIGYDTFALKGLTGLRIETLSKQLGISKSSFYHHFAEMEIFVDALLTHHLKQSEILASKERLAKKINPDLIHILVDHKTDLLFNRQLRIHQEVDSYKRTLSESNEIIGQDFILLWANDLGLQLNQHQLEGLFSLALENFFLQINHDNLNVIWLTKYFDQLSAIARRF
jgi:AcrR family transcriptional regulator